jgi:hypothetical protein
MAAAGRLAPPLAMAVAVRGGQVPGVIMHTGQGSEYTAGLVRQACERLGIRQSMGRPGPRQPPRAVGPGTPPWNSSSARRSTSRPGQRPGPGSAHRSRTTTGTGGTPPWA